MRLTSILNLSAVTAFVVVVVVAATTTTTTTPAVAAGGHWSDWSGCAANDCSESRRRINATTSRPDEHRMCAVSCTYGGWTTWTSCNCRNETRVRTATSVRETPADCPHSTCVNDAVQREPCSSSAFVASADDDNGDCVVSEWSDWSDCRDGQQRRDRYVIELPSCDASSAACPAEMMEAQNCESQSGGPEWWVYFLLALVSALVILVLAVLLVIYRRYRCREYKIPRVSVKPSTGTFDVNDRVATLTNENRRSSRRKMCAPGRSDSRRKKRQSAPTKITTATTNVDEKTETPVRVGQWDTQRQQPHDAAAAVERGDLPTTTDDNSQLVWYFDNDDRASVVQSNTEDREDADDRLAQPLPHSNVYANPGFDLSDDDDAEYDVAAPPEMRLRLDAEGKSDTEDAPTEVGPIAAANKGFELSMSSSPDGEPEPTSPTSIGSNSVYHPKSRGHGIWEYGHEVTADGRKYTKIKATVLRLPTLNTSPATHV